MTYTLSALLGVVAGGDRRPASCCARVLLRRKAFWTAYAIMLFFQLIVNGLLTGTADRALRPGRDHRLAGASTRRSRICCSGSRLIAAHAVGCGCGGRRAARQRAAQAAEPPPRARRAEPDGHPVREHVVVAALDLVEDAARTASAPCAGSRARSGRRDRCPAPARGTDRGPARSPRPAGCGSVRRPAARATGRGRHRTGRAISCGR